MHRSQLFTVVLVLVAALAAGCKGHSPSEPSGPDFISIASISPPGGTKLSPGSKVTITANIDYQETCADSLSPDGGGTITMDILDQNGNFLSPEVKKSVGNGRGSAVLSGNISLPAAGVSQVSVLLDLNPVALNCLLRFQFLTASATYPVAH